MSTNTDTNKDQLMQSIIDAVKEEPQTLAALTKKLNITTQKLIGTIKVMRQNKEVVYNDGLVSVNYSQSVPLTPAPEKTAPTSTETTPTPVKSVTKSSKPTLQTADGMTVRVTKTSIASSVFDRMYAEGASRKDIIAEMTTQAGLTSAGAATYYQNFLNKAKLSAQPSNTTEAE